MPGTRSYSSPGTIPGVSGDVSGIGLARGPGRGFDFLSRRPGVPRAHDPALDPVPLPALEDVVISAGVGPIRAAWLRFNAWLRKPSTRKQGEIGQFVLDYYANTYMPMPGMGGGARLPKLSRGGGFAPSKQRGFLMNPSRVLAPWGTPEKMPATPKRNPAPYDPLSLEKYLVRTTPIRAMQIAPMPILRPTPPPGYEYDPEDLPDLIAQPQPLLSPSRTPARATIAVHLPTILPNPSVQPSPSPTRTPRTANPAPVKQALPAQSPLRSVTQFPFPRTAPGVATQPRDYLMTAAPKPGLSQGPRARGAPSNVRNLTPIPIAQFLEQRAPVKTSDQTTTRTGNVRDGKCECPKEEKKPKGEKKARKKCYEGSYKEKLFSLSKSPRKEIPCQ